MKLGLACGMLGTYELESIFPTHFDGHGFLIRDYTANYTKLVWADGAP